MTVRVADDARPLDLVRDEDGVNVVGRRSPHGQRDRNHRVDFSISQLDLSLLLPRSQVGSLSLDVSGCDGIETAGERVRRRRLGRHAVPRFRGCPSRRSAGRRPRRRAVVGKLREVAIAARVVRPGTGRQRTVDRSSRSSSGRHSWAGLVPVSLTRSTNERLDLLLLVDVGLTVSDVVLDRGGDSDVRVGGVLGVDERVLLDDGRDGGDVDTLDQGLEFDGDGDVVSGGKSSGKRKRRRVDQRPRPGERRDAGDGGLTCEGE